MAGENVNIDRHIVEAHECVPPVISRFWPDVVPLHAIVIIDVINELGKRELLVMTDSEQPPWMASGMLGLVKADVDTDWSHNPYEYESEDDEDEDEDEDDDDYDDE
jgi:hypothetical protein